jgi:hypothetical protein
MFNLQHTWGASPPNPPVVGGFAPHTPRCTRTHHTRIFTHYILGGQTPPLNNCTHDAATSRCPPVQNIYTHAQKNGPCSTLLAYSLCRCYSKSNWSILLRRQGPQQAIQAHNTPAPLHPVHRCKRSSHNHQIPHPPHHQHNATAVRPLQCKPLPRANHVHPGTKFFSHPSPVYSISQMHRPL